MPLRLAWFQEQELTHESAEGDDGQQTLDQNPEPVGQSSVVAAVRIGFDDLWHVGDFKDITEQKPFPQEEPAVQAHDDTLKTTTETKGGNGRGALWSGRIKANVALSVIGSRSSTDSSPFDPEAKLHQRDFCPCLSEEKTKLSSLSRIHNFL